MSNLKLFSLRSPNRDKEKIIIISHSIFLQKNACRMISRNFKTIRSEKSTYKHLRYCITSKTSDISQQTTIKEGILVIRKNLFDCLICCFTITVNSGGHVGMVSYLTTLILGKTPGGS